MGYSGRYHAASLAAVFVALAIGILIGVGLADDVVSSASEELESSLRSDLDELSAEVEDLESELDEQERFAEQAGPALVAGRLARQRVALLALGELPDTETAEDAQRAIEAAGGELRSVAVLDLPPDLAELREAVADRLPAGARDAPIPAERLGVALGRQLVTDGPLIEPVREQLFSRFNGDLVGIDRVVFVSVPPDELQADLSGEGRAFESALIRGIDSGAAGAVGAERSGADPTTVEPFSAAGISTVDNVEQPAGQVALVFALLGAQGDFGVKEGADSLLPDLLPERPGP